jgi:phenylpropionate dioxygenase-like ring-hydroxylating dioxygenase large terminal subunit
MGNFQSQFKNPLESYWYIGCRVKDIAHNKPAAITILGKHLVLFKDEYGNPVALEDRCPHRNAPLSKGRVIEGTIECPYHGWRFNSDGEACSIPSLKDETTKPSAQFHCTHSFPAIEQQGYVWVSLSKAVTQNRPIVFPHLGEKGWTAFHMKTRFKASVEACLENFLDCPHATSVHRFWFRAPTLKRVKAKVKNLSDGVVAEYFQEPREKSLVWWFLSRKKASMVHTDRFIAPATTRVDYVFSDSRHFIITSSCTPISDTETEVYTVMNFKIPGIGPLVKLFFEPLSRKIIEQDVKILNAVQWNMSRFERPSYKFIEPDLLGPSIFKWRKALKNGTAPPEEGLESTLELRL